MKHVTFVSKHLPCLASVEKATGTGSALLGSLFRSALFRWLFGKGA
ncbi:MAG TPA: hypothetical protein PLO62_11895 [Candidatus Hydrogenedentes bacterium]|nr:hypothetical protein [Candidatus Hydrogenedentota bacterium]HOS03370.1 hypothetical protein [Candidatus Hydrogenedentota bacterium]